MNKREHPFFHTMVVFSATLAGCGGKATNTLGERDDQSLSDGGGSSWGTGGVPIEISESGGGTGGEGVGGDLVPQGAGGGFSVGELMDLGCPPAQYTCDADEDLPYLYAQDESSHSGYMLPAGCVCDPNRPVSAAECQEGERLTCWELGFLDSTTRLDRVYPLSCECVPGDAGSCSVACEEHSLRYAAVWDGYICDEIPEKSLSLCGASFVLLK